MNFLDHSDAATIQRWGAVASVVFAIATFIPPLIYLFSSLRTPLGTFSYEAADFLYGPVWAASLLTSVVALRERLGGPAPRRMGMALLAAALAAGALVAVACIRSANRHYHLAHPELHLEDNPAVLIVWTTLVAGLSGAGWHFMGWVQLLVGWAGWTSKRLPRLLCVAYLLTSVVSLFIYRLPSDESGATLFTTVLSLWQAIVFWREPTVGKAMPERLDDS